MELWLVRRFDHFLLPAGGRGAADRQTDRCNDGGGGGGGANKDGGWMVVAMRLNTCKKSRRVAPHSHTRLISESVQNVHRSTCTHIIKGDLEFDIT